MEWLRTHPYASALSVAFVLVIAGIIIVAGRSSVTPSLSEPLTWGGAGTVFGSPAPQSGPAQQGPQDSIQQVEGAAPYTYLPVTPPQASSPGTPASDSFDYNAFISQLSSENQSAPASPKSGGSSVPTSYSFIPNGLISTSTPQTARTALQQTLYDYGNQVGSSVQSFEQQYPNETQILTDQAQDRTDAGKAANVVALGQALSTLGDDLAQMDAGDSTDSGGNQNVPSQMKSAHDALAASYSDLGKKLALVPSAKSDADFIAAVNAYDESVQAFTKSYVALANLFVAYGVSFSPGDPGSVFTFTDSSLSL